MKRVKNIWFINVALYLIMLPLSLWGNNDTVCFNDTILYTINGTPASQFEWKLSGGSVLSTSETNDSIIVVWNVEEGLYNIQVSEQSEQRCPVPTAKLNVFVSKFSLDVIDTISFCEGSAENIIVKPGYEQYIWNGIPGSNSYQVNSAGDIQLEVKNKFGCKVYNTILVTKERKPHPNFIIIKDTSKLSVNVINQSDSLWKCSWNFGDGTYSHSYSPEMHTYTSPGTYRITLTADNNRCTGVISKEINFRRRLKSDFTADYRGCAPLNVNFTNKSVNALSYQWDFGNGVTSIQENPVHIYHNPGIYKVTLTTRNRWDVSISSTYIEVHENPVAKFEVNPASAFTYEVIDFINQSENSVKYLWHFGNGDTSDLYEPIYQYSQPGIYSLILKVWSENGCSDSLNLSNGVIIEPQCKLLFPTGFTPNKSGSNGGYYDPEVRETKNHVFHPLFRDIEEYKLMIYNRWGELVFKSNDIARGWDGYYQGKLSAQDTYLYIVKARCTDGNIIKEKGSVILIH